MKYFNILFLLIICILISSCIIKKPVFITKKRSEIEIDTSKSRKDIEFLCNISPNRNYENIESLNTAAEYISSEFKKLNCDLSVQTYTVDDKIFKNIIATFNKNAKETIILGAHYDVCGNSPGADDNASGISGLLGVARLFDSLKPSLKYRYDFIAFSLEEPAPIQYPMGSFVHAEKIKKENQNLYLMISLDMIGYFSENKNSQDFPYDFLIWFYPNKGNYLVITSKFGQGKYNKKMKKRMREITDIEIRSMNAPSFLKGLDFSDHGNYWKFGYNAICISNTGFLRNPNYHEISDTPQTLDFKKLNKVIPAIYWALINFN